MAGYSGTPLARKLGIAAGDRLALLGAPDGFTIADLPPGVEVRRQARGRFAVILSFHTRRDRLAARFPTLQRALEVDGGLWIAWPKRSSGVVTDVTEDVVRAEALKLDLVDIKVAAVDDVWSGLKLVVRVDRR
jgi:hypothetical protein